MLALSMAIARSWKTLGGVVACGLLLLVALPGGTETAPAVESGPESFTIEASVRATAPGSGPDAGCSERAVRLAPGVTRCLVYRVANHLDVPITVQDITMELDPASPPPPSGCSRDKLSLPGFSGALCVPSGGSATSPGLPIRLESTDTNQDDCQQTTLHFVFAGTAVAGTSGTGRLADTGALLSAGQVAWAVLLGCALVVAGFLVLVAARRRGRRGRDLR